ncbi:hypothetical protein PVAND_012348 [Polypedilum vanderplanki]|uniref:Uncharacterized protein n=1 Tax=Polypedilum vanderplanki TaxID=319348 RepID=A0A9J6CLB8_POLVA|nr:hypothetical protein PVAND_012348 [Polypedilum vanderplanki]
MYYQSDYKFQPRLDYNKNLSNLRRGGRKLNKKHLEPDVIIKHESDEEEVSNEIFECFISFTQNTSMHGVKFIGQSELHWTERIIWSILVIFAIISIIYISLQLSVKFASSPLSTVVESVIHPVSEIPYPSITICPHNRLHAQRAIEAENKFLPNASKETLEIFRFLILNLNNIEFGSFDEFYDEILEFPSNDELRNLNLREVYKFAMLTCDEIFVGKCWWRNKYYECCNDFFEQQTSEYGICFGFNGAVEGIGIAKNENESFHYPLRTSNYGEWSGLRIEISTRTDLSLKEEINGIKVIVVHPNQWPNTGNFIPSGSTTSITIRPTFFYTTDDVRNLEPDDRQCLNDDESKSAMTLPGLTYLQLNCLSECRQQYLHKYCNCSISLFFPIGSYRDCNFDDLKCLNKYNDIFNYEKPPSINPYFNDAIDGMVCGCLPECHRVDYSIEITSNILSVNDNMTLDLHYQSANIVKYRTDITFGWLDLMVSFGGIAGLFMGCSILSGVELFYYSSLFLIILFRKIKNKVDKFLKANSKEFRARDLQFASKRKNKNKKKNSFENVQAINIKVISCVDTEKNKNKF